MAAKITIGEGSGAFVIDANARFDIQRRNNYLENGQVKSQDIFIEIEGERTDKPVETLWDEIVKTDAEVANLAARRVRIELVGAGNKWDFKPGENYNSPRVTSFRAFADPGAAQSRWRYQLSIHVVSFGNAGGQQDKLVDIESSITETEVNEQLTRKIWRVSVVGSSTAQALAVALSFKPDEERLHQEIERKFQQFRVNAVWVWERRRTEKVQEYEETIEITGNGQDFVGQTRVGEPGNPPDPVLHETPLPITVITLRGVVRGYTDELEAPPEHWSESDTMRRAPARELKSKPVPDDQDRGRFILQYQEVWLSTTREIPEPNHGDHEGIQFIEPPADGRAA